MTPLNEAMLLLAAPMLGIRLENERLDLTPTVSTLSPAESELLTNWLRAVRALELELSAVSPNRDMLVPAESIEVRV
jgi:hypothetical protein